MIIKAGTHSSIKMPKILGPEDIMYSVKFTESCRYFIREDQSDKSNKYGYEDLPIGTWFVSMKVRNPEVWERVKKGELKGFSVSGFFEEIEKFYKEKEFLKQLADLLKDID